MVQFSDLDVAIEVSMKKLNPLELFPKPKPFRKITDEDMAKLPADAHIISVANKAGTEEKMIPVQRQRIYIDRTTGKEIGTSDVVTYQDRFIDALGTVTADLITWLLDKDGTYSQVRPYSRTTIMNGNFTVPRASVENWIPESAYEIYVNKSKYKKEPEYNRMQDMLFAKAKEWYDQGIAKIGKWVFREGSQPYVMVLFPYIKKLDNNQFQFCFVAYFSRTKNEYQNLMTFVPQEQKAAVEVVEEPDTEMMLAAIAQ